MKKKNCVSLVLAVMAVALCLPAAFAKEPRKPVAAVTEEKAYLYHVGKNDFQLSFQGTIQTFLWDNDPGARAPEMRVADYDKDGEKEAAVSICIGTGTGLSIDELHLVKKRGDTLTAYTYAGAEYTKHIGAAVSFKTHRENGKLFITFESEKESIRFDVTRYLSEDSPPDSEMKLECGDVVRFTLKDDGTIELKAALGVMVERISPDYFVDATADVAFADGTFSLSGLRLATNDN